jgi:hypothetical protein
LRENYLEKVKSNPNLTNLVDESVTFSDERVEALRKQLNK